MRSTTRRHALLALLSLPFTRVNAEPQFVFLSSEVQPALPAWLPTDTYQAWRSSKRFVVGGQLPSREELRANARALRHLVSRPDTPEIDFLSSELQPVALAPGDNRYQVSE